MKHISQKVDGECGVCCVGMVFEKTFEQVMESVAPDVVPHGIWIPELCHIIKKQTGIDVAVVTYNKDLKQVSQFKFLNKPAIYGVLRLEAANVFHYICCDGKYFYDPLLPNKISLDNAKLDYHSGWLVVSAIFDPNL